MKNEKYKHKYRIFKYNILLFLDKNNKLSKISLKIFGEGVFYINGPQSLPPPLGKKAEEEVMRRIEAGDESVRELLIIHNLRLVVYIARKFENSGVGIEDLISIGTIGLIKAVNTFCPAKNIKLATYASRCIENEILMYLRKTSALKSETSLDEPLNIDWDGNELLLSDVLGSEFDTVNYDIESEDEKKILQNSVEKLGEREKLIINMRFGMDGGREYTQKEVADILGISQSYISRLEKRIIEQLKKEIEKVT
ncbi:MAG: RNA polymerase sporulation sigma factor SigE [Oscillospiraceae bacterium]|nr:RNA polymerase sporulation sigma factor SigE [Oscillospiraceae bacterium]